MRSPFLLVLLMLLPACAAHAQPPAKAFVDLARAYSARDAEAATKAYTSDAEVTYAYDGEPIETFERHAAVEASFADFFGRVDKALPLDLNFRIAEGDSNQAYGYYRLRFGQVETSYGRFEVTFDGNGLFRSDRSSSATKQDFEEATGPLLVAANNTDLDRSYYGLLAGRYLLPNGCELSVTRSFVRLFVRNTCDQSWRGLERKSGLVWTAGDKVLPDAELTTYTFAPVSVDPSKSVTITAEGSAVRAERVDRYTSRNVEFTSRDGTKLAGSIYTPAGAEGKLPAVALVHGSGPQDRDGYASIIAVLADELATAGRIVLAFDKRGSGRSDGDGNRASFSMLAEDAAAAIELLKGLPEVDGDKVGLAGSSQAGWVVAKAIEQDANPADVFLLGAAGAAFTVREQNLYNTEVRMTCAGVSPELRKTALNQQAAFFDALGDRSKAAELDRLTAEASDKAPISDWLFPDSSALNVEDAWFTVLDPLFDPKPIWQSYDGDTTFVFSEFDDSTDTSVALSRLLKEPHKTKVLSSAQHIGLEAKDLCDASLAERQRFSPDLFAAIAKYAAGSSDAN